MGQFSRFASNIVADFPGPEELDWPEVAAHRLALCIEEWPQERQLQAIWKSLKFLDLSVAWETHLGLENPCLIWEDKA